MRGKILFYLLVALMLFAIQSYAQSGDTTAGPVYLTFNGEPMVDPVILIPGETVSIGVHAESGYQVQGIAVFTERKGLQRILTEALDVTHNRSEESRDIATEITLPSLENFKAAEVNFNIKVEDFDGQRRSLRVKRRFIKGDAPEPIKQDSAEEKVIISDSFKEDSITSQPTVDLVRREEVDRDVQEILVYVNKEEEPKTIAIEPNGQLELALDLPGGIFIKRVHIESESRAVKEFFSRLLPKRTGRIVESEQRVQKVTLPETLPKGNYPVTLTIGYVDATFEEQVYSYSFELQSDAGSRIMGAIAERAGSEVFQDGLHNQLKKKARGLGLQDLRAKDLEKLGLNKAEFFALVQEMQRLQEEGLSKEEIMEQLRIKFKRIPEVKRRDAKKRVLKFKEVLQEERPHFNRLKSLSHELDINMETEVYDFVIDDATLTKSQVILSVAGDEETDGEGELILDIPKDIAEHVDEIEWGDEIPEILEEDPVVKWAFQNIPQNEVKEYSFTVNKDVQNFEMLAAGAADSPGFLSRILSWVIGLFA